ncbi:MAG: hypothetical protein ACREIG_05045, partial [Nitrospiraceae bacterium]
FQRGNKGFNQGDALLSLLWAVQEKSVVTILLKFRGSLTECAANTFTELQLNSGPARVEIGEAFPAQVFYLCEKFLKLSCATGEFVNHGAFGARASLL